MPCGNCLEEVGDAVPPQEEILPRHIWLQFLDLEITPMAETNCVCAIAESTYSGKSATADSTGKSAFAAIAAGHVGRPRGSKTFRWLPDPLTLPCVRGLHWVGDAGRTPCRHELPLCWRKTVLRGRRWT